MRIIGESPPQIQFQTDFWLVVLVGVITVALIFLIIFLCKKFGKKELSISKDDVIKVAQPVGPGDYGDLFGRPTKDDERLFFSLKNNKLSIRIIENSKDKDKIIFSSSVAHHFENKNDLLLVIPEIIDATVINTHELLIHKSPAVYLFTIQDQLLHFLFINLENTNLK